MKFFKAVYYCGLALMALAFGKTVLATDYQWIQGYNGWNDSSLHAWNNVEGWSPRGVPASKSDTATIANGKIAGGEGFLGHEGNYPTVNVEAGGTLYILHSITMPLTLAGGTLDGNWRNKTIGPLTITADSQIHSNNDNTDGAGQVLIGEIHNTKPVTLFLDGDQSWSSHSRDTFSGTIEVIGGTLFLRIDDTRDAFGKGNLVLAPGGCLCFREMWNGNPMAWTLRTDVLGNGTIQTGQGREGQWVTAKAINIHPGKTGMPGTLAFNSNLQFALGDNSAPNHLLIEVAGTDNRPDTDYGQLLVKGTLTDSLDAMEINLIIDPAIPREKLSDLCIKAVYAAQTNMSGGHFKLPRVITIKYGTTIGEARARFISDGETGSFLEIYDVLK